MRTSFSGKDDGTMPGTRYDACIISRRPYGSASRVELRLAIRRSITQTIVRTYPQCLAGKKAAILDHLVEVTSWHRDHARKALRQALAEADQVADQPVPVRRPPASQAPVSTYGTEVNEALTKVWAVLDGPDWPAVPANPRAHREARSAHPCQGAIQTGTPVNRAWNNRGWRRNSSEATS